MSISAKEQLLFIVNHPGSPPYLYYDGNREYRGVIPDVLKGLIETNQLNVRFVSNSRKRSEEQLYQGDIDLIMLSTAWLKKPERVISSVPIHQHRSFLYREKEFFKEFSLDNTTGNERLCTRKGFVYPNLSEYIKKKRLVRVDSSSHLSMLRMLFKQRCDYVVMNEYNAENLMNSSFFTGKKLFRSHKAISTVPLNIILRAELKEVKQLLDTHIIRLQDSGELRKFVEKHTFSPE